MIDINITINVGKSCIVSSVAVKVAVKAENSTFKKKVNNKMALNEHLKYQWKNFITLLLLNILALVAVNDSLIVKASGVSKSFEKFAEEFFYGEMQKNPDKFIFAPFVVQTFEDMIGLAFSDKPIQPDEEFSQIIKHIGGGDGVSINFTVYSPEEHDLDSDKLALIRQNFPTFTTFAHIASSQSWIADAIKAHKNMLESLEKITGIRQKVSDKLMTSRTKVITDWQSPFDQTNTKPGKFKTESNEIILPFMQQESTCRMSINDDLKAKIVEMPLKDENFNVWFFLPNDKDGVKDLGEKLKAESLKNIDSAMTEQVVGIRLPKFKDSTEINLDEEITKAGIQYPLEVNSENPGAIIERPAINIRTDLTMCESLAAKDTVETIDIGEAVVDEVSPICNMDSCVEFNAAHPFIYHVVHKGNDKIVPIVMGYFKNVNINKSS
uniref:Serpin domain-containing protein n=1 Tax=Glossina palpalis gambiensis TaxID=67801 RepID=A0A1B0B3J1_9MUSC